MNEALAMEILQSTAYLFRKHSHRHHCFNLGLGVGLAFRGASDFFPYKLGHQRLGAVFEYHDPLHVPPTNLSGRTIVLHYVAVFQIPGKRRYMKIMTQ